MPHLGKGWEASTQHQPEPHRVPWGAFSPKHAAACVQLAGLLCLPQPGLLWEAHRHAGPCPAPPGALCFLQPLLPQLLLPKGSSTASWQLAWENSPLPPIFSKRLCGVISERMALICNRDASNKKTSLDRVCTKSHTAASPLCWNKVQIQQQLLCNPLCTVHL